jgi:hypothetical protein
MITYQAQTLAETGSDRYDEWVAARRVHEAEMALHDARGTGVDAWIAAAADRLHDALCQYTAAAASGGTPQAATAATAYAA